MSLIKISISDREDKWAAGHGAEQERQKSHWFLSSSPSWGRWTCWGRCSCPGERPRGEDVSLGGQEGKWGHTDLKEDFVDVLVVLGLRIDGEKRRIRRSPWRWLQLQRRTPERVRRGLLSKNEGKGGGNTDCSKSHLFPAKPMTMSGFPARGSTGRARNTVVLQLSDPLLGSVESDLDIDPRERRVLCWWYRRRRGRSWLLCSTWRPSCGIYEKSSKDTENTFPGQPYPRYRTGRRPEEARRSWWRKRLCTGHKQREKRNGRNERETKRIRRAHWQRMNTSDRTLLAAGEGVLGVSLNQTGLANGCFSQKNLKEWEWRTESGRTSLNLYVLPKPGFIALEYHK